MRKSQACLTCILCSRAHFVVHVIRSIGSKRGIYVGSMYVMWQSLAIQGSRRQKKNVIQQQL